MPPTTDLNAGMRCIKFLLFSFNLLFVITGILLILVGTTIQTIFSDYIIFIEDHFFSPAILIVVVGVIVFMVAFFGCCGAVRESTCMIMVFAVLLSIIFVLETSAGIAAYVLQSGLDKLLDNKISEIIHSYKSNEKLAETFDAVQHGLQCCGNTGYPDWKTELLNGSQAFPINGIYVPWSCCENRDPQSLTCPDPFTTGCLERINYVIGQSALMIATAAISVALLQLLGVMFACSLGKSIRAYKTERERRRVELQEQLINSYSLIGTADPKTIFPVVYMDPKNNSTC